MHEFRRAYILCQKKSVELLHCKFLTFFSAKNKLVAFLLIVCLKILHLVILSFEQPGHLLLKGQLLFPGSSDFVHLGSTVTMTNMNSVIN